MKPASYKEGTFGSKLMCSIFGHKFRMTKLVTEYFREFECSVCHAEVTNDISGRRITLTNEHREINETLFNFYQKRHAHS